MARLTICGLVKLTNVPGLVTPRLFSTVKSVEILFTAGLASMETHGKLCLRTPVSVVEAPVTRTSDTSVLRTCVLLEVEK